MPRANGFGKRANEHRRDDNTRWNDEICGGEAVREFGVAPEDAFVALGDRQTEKSSIRLCGNHPESSGSHSSPISRARLRERRIRSTTTGAIAGRSVARYGASAARVRVRRRWAAPRRWYGSEGIQWWSA